MSAEEMVLKDDVGFMAKGSYLVPEDQMLAIGAVLVYVDEVCEAFDLGCQTPAEDFVDQVASKVYDLRKAAKELKALKDGE